MRCDASAFQKGVLDFLLPRCTALAYAAPLVHLQPRSDFC